MWAELIVEQTDESIYGTKGLASGLVWWSQGEWGVNDENFSSSSGITYQLVVQKLVSQPQILHQWDLRIHVKRHRTNMA